MSPTPGGVRGCSSPRIFRAQAFPLGMATAVGLAFWAPATAVGASSCLDLAVKAGIFAVFFLHGVGLSSERLRAGLSRWRVHLVVQGFTFGVFPLVWWGVQAGAGRYLPPDLRLGSCT